MKQIKLFIIPIALIFFSISYHTISCAAATPPSSLHAKAAVLMDGTSQRVLFGKEEQTELPMASTTKIMTCLYALEHGKLTDIVTFGEKAASAPKVHLGAPAGSQFLLSDLLYALMLESDNDAAIAIAEHISGSVESFCDEMTREAKDYGCFHTSFETPNGLDSDKHYTTCYDLALLTCRALQNKRFCTIIKESTYSIKDLQSGKSYTLQNKNAFLQSYPGAIGVKTGYTSGAGYCFVGAVKKSDRLLISVVLGCGWPPHRSWKWEDTKKLMDYGINNYTTQTVSLQKDLPELLPVDFGQTDICHISSKASVSLLLSKEESITINTDIPSVLTAPVSKDEIIGNISLYIDDALFRSYPVTTSDKIAQINYKYCLKNIWRDFLGLSAPQS